MREEDIIGKGYSREAYEKREKEISAIKKLEENPSENGLKMLYETLKKEKERLLEAAHEEANNKEKQKELMKKRWKIGNFQRVVLELVNKVGGGNKITIEKNLDNGIYFITDEKMGSTEMLAQGESKVIENLEIGLAQPFGNSLIYSIELDDGKGKKGKFFSPSTLTNLKWQTY